MPHSSPDRADQQEILDQENQQRRKRADPSLAYLMFQQPHGDQLTQGPVDDERWASSGQPAKRPGTMLGQAESLAWISFRLPLQPRAVEPRSDVFTVDHLNRLIGAADELRRSGPPCRARSVRNIRETFE